MNDKARARGLAKHKSGEYSAALVLEFESPLDALQAIQALGVGWERGSQRHNCLAWIGTPQEFEQVKKALVAFGADPSRLEVLKRPGEKFSIEIPYFPELPKALLQLI